MRNNDVTIQVNCKLHVDQETAETCMNLLNMYCFERFEDKALAIESVCGACPMNDSCRFKDRVNAEKPDGHVRKDDLKGARVEYPDDGIEAAQP